MFRIPGSQVPNHLRSYFKPATVPTKSLTGIPWRYAIRCIDELGLILRAEVIWSKPNGLPESVTDRVRRSHEQWFCFEQSGGVEAAAQNFPFCPLCGRPVDARATLIRRLKECDSGVESVGVADEMGPDVRSQSQDARGRHSDVAVGALVPPVPSLDEGDIHRGQDAAHLVENGVAAVVDRDAQNGAALPTNERDGALSVDDSSEPSGVCECEGHALTLNDEPWLPQSLAAEIMQRVADGEIDPQQAADFLAGDYVRNHSVWFHFTLEPRYFSAVDEIREPHRSEPGREGKGALGGQKSLRPVGPNSGNYNTLGALPGSVWTIPTEPLRVPESLGIDHFAAFPTEWPRRIIQGWSPREVCTACGFLLGSNYDIGLLGVRKEVRAVGAQGSAEAVLRQDVRKPLHRQESTEHKVSAPDDSRLRRGLEAGSPDGAEVRVSHGASAGHGGAPGQATHPVRGGSPQERDQDGQPDRESGASREGRSRPPAEAGSQALPLPALRRADPDLRDALSCPHCGCDRLRPAVIADPFGGTGTTALVADVLGRHGVSVDMSGDYCRLAHWRTTDPQQRARAARVEAVDPVPDDQPDLFEESA